MRECHPIHRPIALAQGGRTNLVQTNATAAALFVATGSIDPRTNDTVFVVDVAIRNIVCVGPTTSSAVAVDVVGVSGLSVTGCVAHGLGLVRVDTPFSINVWDKSSDPAATAGLVRVGQLSHGLVIANNSADGGGGGGSKTIGVQVQYVSDVLVDNNTLAGFAHGIMWWGGDANPSRGGDPVNPRWARGVTVSNNVIMSVGGGGVWGSMGQDVTGASVKSPTAARLD